MQFPRLHGAEFVALPLATLIYFAKMTDFTWPGALLNNAIVTAATAGVAWWRSKQLADFAEKRGDRRERLAPIGYFACFLLLVFCASLQLIAAVTHISYYRNGPMVTDLFDR